MMQTHSSMGSSVSRFSRPRALAAVVFVAVGGQAMAARAGVTIVFQHGAAEPSTAEIEGDHARIDSPMRQKFTAVIVDAAGKKMTMVDDNTKSYVDITEEDMKKFRGQLEAMRSQMQERLKNLPPEQRQKMEALMGKMGNGPGNGAAGGKPEKHVFKFDSMGQKKTVNGMSCQMFKVNRDGKPFEQDCISPWSAGLLKKSDFESMRKFGQEMAQGMGMKGGGSGQLFEDMDQYPGIPVSRVRLNDDGTLGEEDQIKSISRGSIAAARFAVPAGYAKKDVSSLMGGAGAGTGRGDGVQHLGPMHP
ncbi:MAG TPA: hypothetical protein VGL59_07225 [Polyangia bacterium]